MKPNVCLHMIIRDESEIIERCLRSILPHVDAAVIVDTGSVDDTVDIAQRLLDEWGEPSMLVTRQWKGFAQSRTEAMELARSFVETIADADDAISMAVVGKPHRPEWLLFTLDADETFEPEPGFQWPSDDLDAWHVRILLNGIRYTRTLLTRASTPWRYEGALHEDVTLDRPYRCGAAIPGCIVRSTRDGARAKDAGHYARDAEVLLEQHERTPDDARTVFYLANSYRDAGNLEEALRWYDKRAAMPGWQQETWATMHERARCMIMLGRDPKEVLEAHLLAYGLRPGRAETLRQLAVYLRSISAPEVAALFDREADRLPLSDDLLFVDTHAYHPAPRIGIITAPRPDGSFPLATTLTACMAADEHAGIGTIKVFNDGTERLPIPPVVAQEPADEDTLRRIRQGGIYGTLNYCRALEWGAGGDGVCVVLEDDVLFARGWLRRSTALLSEAERSVGGPVLLSLHHMFGDLSGVLLDAGIAVGDSKLQVPGPGAFPNGSQGVMCRPEVAKTIAAVLRNRMGCSSADERKAWAMDVGLWRCCQELGLARLMYVYPCVLWHLDSAPSTWASRDARWLGDDAAHRAVRKTMHFRPW